MNNETISQTTFTKALLTSVFVGFFITIICLIYDIIFRESTGYHPADYINVSSLIFGINLIFLVIGAVYFLFVRYRKGDILFSILLGVITIICVWRADYANMGNSHVLSTEFRTLLIGTIVILGIGATLVVPVLFHNKRFLDYFI